MGTANYLRSPSVWTPLGVGVDAAIWKPRRERAALLAEADVTATAATAATAHATRLRPKIAETYRATVLDIGHALGDERCPYQARAELRRVVGDRIPLKPAASRDHLVAELTNSRVALLKAAGA